MHPSEALQACGERLRLVRWRRWVLLAVATVSTGLTLGLWLALNAPPRTEQEAQPPRPGARQTASAAGLAYLQALDQDSAARHLGDELLLSAGDSVCVGWHGWAYGTPPETGLGTAVIDLGVPHADVDTVMDAAAAHLCPETAAAYERHIGELVEQDPGYYGEPPDDPLPPGWSEEEPDGIDW